MTEGMGRAAKFLTALAVAACSPGEQSISLDDPSRVSGPCPRPEVMVLGACFDPRTAREVCFPGHPAAGRCSERRCAEPLVPDRSRGLCLSERQVRAIAAEQGLGLGPDEGLNCRAGSSLAVWDDAVVCQTAVSDEDRGGASCGWGSLREAAGCRPILRPLGRTLVTDVVAWLQLSFGPGTDLCSAIRGEAGLGGSSGTVTEFTVEIEATFPGNDVQSVLVRTRVPGTTGLEGAAGRVVERRLLPLRTLGGTALTSFAATSLACLAVPATGAFVLPKRVIETVDGSGS